MSVYGIATIDIHDRERYGLYEAGFMEIFERFGGRLLAVDEAPTVVEGQWPCTRTVLVEFPSKEQFDAWYHSADYQALLEHRLAASEASIALIQSLAA